MIKKLGELLNSHGIEDSKQNELISDLLILFNVSNSDSGLPELSKFPLKNGVCQVWDKESDSCVHEGTSEECDEFINGYNGC